MVRKSSSKIVKGKIVQGNKSPKPIGVKKVERQKSTINDPTKRKAQYYSNFVPKKSPISTNITKQRKSSKSTTRKVSRSKSKTKAEGPIFLQFL